MLRQKSRDLIVVALVVAALGAGWVANRVQTGGQGYSLSVALFERVAAAVASRYVEDVDPNWLVQAAIRGMLAVLDPHSQFLEKKRTEEMKMMELHGKYGGLGIKIGIQDDVLTVIAPFEETPAYRAGIQAGDRIIRIDGQPTKGMTTDDAAEKLRGPPGTVVAITIDREGQPRPVDYPIQRAVIEIPVLPYAGIIADSICYVRLSQFTEDAGAKVREALRQLSPRATTGLILDLRTNPGGLLDQGVAVADLFLEPGEIVVYTRGRSQGQNVEYRSEHPPLWRGRPIIVLVNGYSASASEIVAGAIQDWDRGLILGTPTYGKGLVQTVFEMPEGASLKLTTAKYYTPSGRCIQNPAEGVDSLVFAHRQHPKGREGDSLSIREVFRTARGRPVYGGGGIVPDVELPEEEPSELEQQLLQNAMFFKFAVAYIAKHKNLRRNFVVDSLVVNEFRYFLRSRHFEYKTRAEQELDKLSEALKGRPQSRQTREAIERLREQLAREKEADFSSNIEAIKRRIEVEIAANLWGTRERYERGIRTDPQVLAAIKILSTPGAYDSKLWSNAAPGREAKTGGKALAR